MKRIDNWDNIKEGSSYQRLPVGGYIVGIKSVKNQEDKNCLVVFFDICKGDKKNWYQKEYDNDTRSTKIWPNAATLYRSYKETALPMFKGFITAVENSNPGYKWDWDEQTLKNKVFGIVMGEEEYLNSKGQKRIRNRVVGVRSVKTIESGEFTIPELKKLDPTQVATANSNNTTSAKPFVDPFAAKPEPEAEKEPSPFDDSPSPFD